MKLLLVASRAGMVSQFMRESLGPLLADSGVEVSISRAFPKDTELDGLDVLISDSLQVQQISNLRAATRHTLVGVADPKLHGGCDRHVVQLADFALVASRELESRVATLGTPSAMVYWVPDLTQVRPKFSKYKSIGYHGNKVHLQSMESSAWPALLDARRRAESQKFSLDLHYNIEKLGLWHPPSGQHSWVRHHQFAQPDTWSQIASSSMGIIPNLLPIKIFSGESGRFPRLNQRVRRLGLNPLLLRLDDVGVRYKLNSNAARIYPFAFFKIPVVADLSLSVAEFVTHRHNSLMAWDRHSWQQAIDFSINNPTTMSEFGERLHERVVPLMSPRASASRVLSLLAALR